MCTGDFWRTPGKVEHGIRTGESGAYVDHFWYFAPVEFSNSDAAEAAAKKLGYSHMDIYAGAGHDACYMADIVPTAMVFTPCKDGISHNEIESTTKEQCEAGCNVLMHAMLGDAKVIA